MNLVQNDRMKPSLCEITSRMKQHYLYDSTTLMCYRSQHRARAKRRPGMRVSPAAARQLPCYKGEQAYM